MDTTISKYALIVIVAFSLMVSLGTFQSGLTYNAKAIGTDPIITSSKTIYTTNEISIAPSVGDDDGGSDDDDDDNNSRSDDDDENRAQVDEDGINDLNRCLEDTSILYGGKVTKNMIDNCYYATYGFDSSSSQELNNSKTQQPMSSGFE